MQPDRPMVDEQSISDGRVGSAIAPVTLVGVDDPVPTVRVKTDEVVLSGDGAGIVDAAGAGIIDGTELIRYSASLDDGLVDALRSASRLVVTDTNRDRAHHWRSSQDVTGFTESGGADSDVLRFEGADQRLPVFDTADEATQTISVQSGPVTAAASAYGEPFAYLPEHRPVMAIDGDPATSWTVADRAPGVGEFIVLSSDAGIDHVTLRQPDAGPDDRTITAIDLVVDDRPVQRVELDHDLVGRLRPAHRRRADRRPHRGDHHHRRDERPRSRRSATRCGESASARSTSGSDPPWSSSDRPSTH